MIVVDFVQIVVGYAGASCKYLGLRVDWVYSIYCHRFHTLPSYAWQNGLFRTS